MVRDEQDIIGWTLSRMASQLDHVLVMDNLSTDGTLSILQDSAARLGNITIIDDPEPAYMQSIKMSTLARVAGELGADMVVPFDADEVWQPPPDQTLTECLNEQTAHVMAVELVDHIAVRGDPEVPDVLQRICWRRANPLPLPKVAARVLLGLVIEQGNHGAHYPGPHKGCSVPIVVHHYPYRSAEQMARKAANGAAAYAAAGDRLPASAGQHWREYGRFYEQGGIEAIREIFETWFYSTDPEADELVYDPCTVPMP